MHPPSAPRGRLHIVHLLIVLLLTAPLAAGCWESGRSNAAPATAEQSTAEPAGQSPAPAAGQPASQPPGSPAAQASIGANRDQRSVTLTQLAHLPLADAGFHGDVWAHNGVAYIGTWGAGGACPATGVKVVDIADPTAPRWVSTVAAIPSTSQEDVVVRSVATRAFTGDLLVVGIQACDGNGRAGISVWDVTDPRRPEELSFFASGVRGVHELDVVQQGGRALALLAVPSSEARTGTGDLRIVDLTDPRRPAQIAHWGAVAGGGIDLRAGTGCIAQTYLHSVRASADGRRAYLSYWDAGVFILDITEPSSPRLLGRLAHADHEEGAAHSVAETADGRYLLVADEHLAVDDRGLFGLTPGLTLGLSAAGGERSIPGCQATFGRSVDQVGPIRAPVVDAGAGCPGAALPSAVDGRIAVVRDGGCSLTEKAGRLADAGALAVIAGMEWRPQALGPGRPASIPVITVSANDAAVLRAASGATVALPSARPWSGLRVWEIADPANPRQVATYQTPNSLAVPPPTDGIYSIHNAEVAGDLGLISWYSDGVRVLDLADPAAPREVASFVPPQAPNPWGSYFADGPMVWGVHVAGDLVLLSDINGGLYILRWREE